MSDLKLGKLYEVIQPFPASSCSFEDTHVSADALVSVGEHLLFFLKKPTMEGPAFMYQYWFIREEGALIYVSITRTATENPDSNPDSVIVRNLRKVS